MPPPLDDQLSFFDGARGYLFRGTRPTWSYDRPYRGANITPTTIDALVAALFAALCRCEGEAIVLVADKEKFRGRLSEPNHFLELERSVHVEIRPDEFEAEADKTLSLSDAIALLRELGFDPPERLRDRSALQQALHMYPRMAANQIEQFARAALEIDA